MARVASTPYPKPGPVGGRLIRGLVQRLRGELTSHILIGVSGGSDSVALAVLLARYGRKIVSPERITLLHVNHQWRGEESEEDARFVRAQAKALGVRCKVIRLPLPSAEATRGDSWEELARRARKSVFERESSRLGGAPVLTAHQGDDLAETLLWRLFTGAARTHGAGIRFRHGVELRPLLAVRKAALQAFLREEGRGWREDATNSSGRFLRSRMRMELLPQIEALFPRAMEHLIAEGLRLQEVGPAVGEAMAPAAEAALFAAQGLGLRLKRVHIEEVARAVKLGRARRRIELPEGWSLTRESGI
jgi:tRNA(Ile)-lysidine synthase